MSEDNRDYWAAFAIGAIVGVGATLLLSPPGRMRARRILSQIEPAIDRARRRGRRRFRKTRKSLRRRI